MGPRTWQVGLLSRRNANGVCWCVRPPPPPTLQISALLKHESQYSNATDVAQGVQSLAAYIAQQVNATAPAWYAEGFTHIPQMG